VAVDVWVAEQWRRVVGVTIIAIHGSGPGSRVRGVVAVGYSGGGGRRDPVVVAVVVVDVREWWWSQNGLAAWVTDAVCRCGSTSCLDVVVMPLTVWWRSWRSCHRRVAGCTDVIVVVVVDAVVPLAHGCSGGCRGCCHREGGGTAFNTVALPVARQS